MHKATLISCLILQLTTLFTNAQDTDELKTIFEFHNKVRLSALNGEIPNQPKAKEMPELTWNDKLAELAQQHVEKCVLEKSNLDELFVGKYDKVGQAVAEHQSIQKHIISTVITGTREIEASNLLDLLIHRDLLLLMTSPNKDEMRILDSTASHHPPIIVWAATKDIGCGSKLCGKKQTVVCNYGPGADEGKPYEKA